MFNSKYPNEYHGYRKLFPICSFSLINQKGNINYRVIHFTQKLQNSKQFIQNMIHISIYSTLRAIINTDSDTLQKCYYQLNNKRNYTNK